MFTLPEIKILMGDILQAGGLALILSILLFPRYIRWLKEKSFGQQIREEGPEHHHVKKNTPTMGGLLIIIIGLAVSLFMGRVYLTPNYYAFAILVTGVMFLGLFDDLSKIMKKQSLGLRAREKMAIQIILGCLLVIYIYKFTRIDIGIIIPFFGTITSKIAFLLFAVFVFAGTINAVNLTDGLDGLATGTCAIGFLAYTVICYKNQQYDLAIASFSFLFACVGFLWFNAYPAKVFMGDTGSLALGCALGTLAVLSRTEFLLIIIGGVFVAEALSVIIQVTYFKLTGGKRIFLMSPLHHHFEKLGWHEVEVTTRFCITGLALSVVGLILYFRDFLKF